MWGFTAVAVGGDNDGDTQKGCQTAAGFSYRKDIGGGFHRVKIG